MNRTNYRTDCFAHKGNKCSALTVMYCDGCKFYKKSSKETAIGADKRKECNQTENE